MAIVADQPVADGFGVVPVGQVHQHGVAGGALDEGGDGGLVGLAHDQIALPVSGYRAVLDLGGAVADHDHRVDEAVRARSGERCGLRRVRPDRSA